MDRRGRGPVLVLSLAVSTVLLFLYSLVQEPVAIMVLRCLQGLVWGWLSTAFSTVASDYIPREKYGEGISIFNMASGLGFGLTPIFVFAIYTRFGIRPLSYAAVLLSVITLLLAFRLRLKPLPIRQEDKQLDDTGSDVAARPGSQRQWIERAALLPALAILVDSLSIGAVFSFVTLYGIERGIHSIGSFMTVFSLTGLLARPVMGRLYDRIGSRLTLYPGLIVTAIGLAMLAMARSDAAFIVTAIVIALGDSAAFTSLLTIAITRSDPDRLGTANATFYNGMDAGFGFGAIIAGGLAGMLGYSGMYLVMMLGPIAAMIVSMIGARRPSEAKVGGI